MALGHDRNAGNNLGSWLLDPTAFGGTARFGFGAKLKLITHQVSQHAEAAESRGQYAQDPGGLGGTAAYLSLDGWSLLPKLPVCAWDVNQGVFLRQMTKPVYLRDPTFATPVTGSIGQHLV